MPSLKSLACVAVLGAVAASAQAAFVQVKFDNPIFEGVPAPAYDVVTITFPAPVGSTSQSANVAAGRFQGTASNLVGVDPSLFVDGLDNLFMYCYDIYEHIGSGWSVNYTINMDGERARSLDFLGAVNAVLNLGRPSYDNFAWLHPQTGAIAAAIQIGLWESRYDGDGWSLGAGGFRASGLEAPTANALAQFFTAIGSTPSLDGRYVMTLDAPGAQDMITGDPPADVPEPAALALTAAALGGLALASRRRRAAGVAARVSAAA